MKDNNRKAQIVQAAAACFTQYGYDKTTLDDIGKKCHMNKASLYYYYKNKEDIFVQVILNECDGYLESLEKRVNATETYEDKVLTFTLARLRKQEQPANLYQLSVDKLQRAEPLFEDLYKIVLDKEISALTMILQNATQGSIAIIDDAKQVAAALLKITEAVKHDAIRVSTNINSEETDIVIIENELKFIIRLVLNGLKITTSKHQFSFS